LNFVNIISSGFKQTFDYRGRATRAEFWIWYAFTVVIGLAGYYAFAFSPPEFELFNFFYYLGLDPHWAVGFFLCIPTWAFMNRRIRDTGLNPLWLFLNLIPLLLYVVAMIRVDGYWGGPFIGIDVFVTPAMAIVNIVFMCLPSKKGESK